MHLFPSMLPTFHNTNSLLSLQRRNHMQNCLRAVPELTSRRGRAVHIFQTHPPHIKFKIVIDTTNCIEKIQPPTHKYFTKCPPASPRYLILQQP